MAESTLQRKFLPYGCHSLDEDDIQSVVSVLRNGPLTQGPKIAEFEGRVAEYVGVKYAVAVSSGTAALHLAALAAGIKPGEGLITSPNSFIASANCGLYVGASPQFADIEPDSLNMSPAALEVALEKSPQARVVVPVHFAGVPCDMAAISKIARRRRLVIIEDAAHSIGAVYPEGGRVGNCALSDMTIFSFHPVKLIAAGEGGMITTNDEKIYNRLMLLRTHGISKSSEGNLQPEMAFTNGKINPWYYEMQVLGYNYRITDIQAALALSQFKRIDNFLARRRFLALRYDEKLKGLPAVTIPQTSTRSRSAHHLYIVRIDFDRVKISRQEFMDRLRDKGVGSQVHYIPIHLQPVYRNLGFKKGDFPEAERYYSEVLSLPLYVGLSDDDQDRVVRAIKDLLPAVA